MNNNFNFGDGSNVFFTSDLHFGHSNIIHFCKRPFKNVEEMNQTLVDNWNKVVPKDGIVFMLGDFCFGGLPTWEKWRNKLNGKIYLILGNHDRKNVNANSIRMNKMFEMITPEMQIQIDGKSVYLNHYPFLCYGGAYRGKNSVWQLFGHVHSSPNKKGKDSKRLKHCFSYQLDVGVDNFDYTPVPWKEVRRVIEKQIKSHNFWRQEKRNKFIVKIIDKLITKYGKKF